MALRAEDVDLGRDRDLVVACQAGDHGAFDALYRLHFDRLRRFCLRRVSDPGDAEEIAQEAFTRAYQALPRLDGERRFYPWMTVIASRLCVDHYRRRGRVQPSDDIDPGVVDEDPTARLSRLDDLALLARAMERLGPRHAEVLTLREHRGMSYNEIADELDVPHSTVEALLFRARRALRREYLAVAGGRLASLPGVAWLVRHGARLRDRLAPWAEQLVPFAGPVAAGVAAITIGLGAAGTAGTAGTSQRVTSAGHAASATTIAAATPTSTNEVAAATPSARPPAAPKTGLAGATVMPPEQARAAASDMPAFVDLGSLFIGIDPAMVGPWLGENVLNQEDQ